MELEEELAKTNVSTQQVYIYTYVLAWLTFLSLPLSLRTTRFNIQTFYIVLALS
jgi:hypothetical protein